MKKLLKFSRRFSQERIAKEAAALINEMAKKHGASAKVIQNFNLKRQDQKAKKARIEAARLLVEANYPKWLVGKILRLDISTINHYLNKQI